MCLLFFYPSYMIRWRCGFDLSTYTRETTAVRQDSIIFCKQICLDEDFCMHILSNTLPVSAVSCKKVRVIIITRWIHPGRARERERPLTQGSHVFFWARGSLHFIFWQDVARWEPPFIYHSPLPSPYQSDKSKAYLECELFDSLRLKNLFECRLILWDWSCVSACDS